jgi:hypothetical protein
MGGQGRMGKGKKGENIRRMRHKTNINPSTLLQKPNHILGPKTITHTPNPLITLLLQILNTLLHNRIHEFPRMSIIPACPFRQPSHQIEAIWAVEGELVAIEEIGDECVVAVGGELVGD